MIEKTTILKCVCDAYGVSRDDVMSWSIPKSVALARHVSMFLMHEQGDTFKSIGEFFDRDHSTVMHAVSRIIKACEDRNFRGEVRSIAQRLGIVSTLLKGEHDVR